MIDVRLHVRERSGPKESSHTIDIEINADASFEAVIEELDQMVKEWALTWTRYPGTVTIRTAENEIARN